MKITTKKLGKLKQEDKTPFRGHVVGFTFRGSLALLRRGNVAPFIPVGFQLIPLFFISMALVQITAS